MVLVLVSFSWFVEDFKSCTGFNSFRFGFLGFGVFRFWGFGVFRFWGFRVLGTFRLLGFIKWHRQ